MWAIFVLEVDSKTNQFRGAGFHSSIHTHIARHIAVTYITINLPLNVSIRY